MNDQVVKEVTEPKNEGKVFASKEAQTETKTEVKAADVTEKK